MSYKLSEVSYIKENFDPNNLDHVNHYKYFLEHNRWSVSCPFRVEWPFVTVPELIKDRLIKKYLNNIIEHIEAQHA
jgi:hypothetical protein